MRRWTRYISPLILFATFFVAWFPFLTLRTDHVTTPEEDKLRQLLSPPPKRTTDSYSVALHLRNRPFTVAGGSNPGGDLSLTVPQQAVYVQKHCPAAAERFASLPPASQLSEFVWGLCATREALQTQPTVLWWDGVSPILVSELPNYKNLAIESDNDKILASILVVSQSDWVDRLLQWMIATPDWEHNPLALPQFMYELIPPEGWFLWQQSWFPGGRHFSSSIWGPDHSLVAVSPHSIYPAPPHDDTWYRARISTEYHDKPPDFAPSPNLLDLLITSQSLPSLECLTCLAEIFRDHSCPETVCGDSYQVCATTVPKKWVGQTWTVHPPLLSDRTIPRIVHQTWYEVPQSPALRHMTQSFEESGWEYRFYTDDVIAAFLDEHFPPAVREAFDSLIPGAFKADLFRYCVLLIHGGLYADVDILLQTNLDEALPDNATFVVPLDDPGHDSRACLWNGFMAAAPGHPYLAEVIERVVNQVRNRFTSLDIDASMCPHPDLVLLHHHDMLFVSGPCALGASVQQSSEVDGALYLSMRKDESGSQSIVGEDGRVWAMTDLIAKSSSHYSSSRKHLIYGMSGVYADGESADEDVEMIVLS